MQGFASDWIINLSQILLHGVSMLEFYTFVYLNIVHYLMQACSIQSILPATQPDLPVNNEKVSFNSPWQS